MPLLHCIYSNSIRICKRYLKPKLQKTYQLIAIYAGQCLKLAKGKNQATILHSVKMLFYRYIVLSGLPQVLGNFKPNTSMYGS